MRCMGDLSHLSAEQPIDLDGLRKRLVKMSDAELRRFAGRDGGEDAATTQF